MGLGRALMVDELAKRMCAFVLDGDEGAPAPCGPVPTTLAHSWLDDAGGTHAGTFHLLDLLRSQWAVDASGRDVFLVPAQHVGHVHGGHLAGERIDERGDGCLHVDEDLIY